MYNVKLPFFSVLFLITVHVNELNCMDFGPDTVPVAISRSPSRAAVNAEMDELSVDRSPSTAPDMPGYLHYVEQKVTAQEEANPGRKIYLDFNTQLLGLFQRLRKDADDATKIKWQTAFNILATNLARYHENVRGVKMVYGNNRDFPIASSLIAPFVSEQKLEKMEIAPLLEMRI
jgi:hypothetical protein